ncbi:MAG: aminotransferase class I/II-fold pyridoxal phosphate-dependent enzyme, partial [Myxococcota bacterium]
MTAMSARGRRLLEGALPTYLVEHFAHQSDRYSTTHPDGYVGLCVAENALVWDLFEERVRRPRPVAPEHMGYGEMRGSEAFRARIAHLFSERIAHREISPDQVTTLAGAGSILETLFYVIGDPGDGVLIPTPSYAGFWLDLELRDELRVIPVHGDSATG